MWRWKKQRSHLRKCSVTVMVTNADTATATSFLKVQILGCKQQLRLKKRQDEMLVHRYSFTGVTSYIVSVTTESFKLNWNSTEMHH